MLRLLLWMAALRCALSDALHPVRYPTEEAFFRANTHERTSSIAEMEDKIAKIRKRRNFKAWNSSVPEVAEKIKVKRPNILFILADDLGYGDLSVEPFSRQFDRKEFPCAEGGILTPVLEQMAHEGVIMTNFHAAAPVCSPSRAAIMTGVYSWRLNAMNAFEVSKEDLTQLNGFLLQTPTIAEYLREEGGYFTAHSGKWHIGGMREENRRSRANALDGPESPRYSFLNREDGLHVKGHRHRIKNDIPVPIIEKPGVKQHVLSDYEAGDAIEMMKLAKEKYSDQPWFIQV
jgi:arylsulfatase A-like enzyme